MSNKILDRIPLEDVKAAAHIVWVNPEIADQISLETIQIINKTYHRKFSFFNGRRSTSLVAGLFYLLSYRYNAVKKQNELADKLGTSDVSIRSSYRLWLETFPDLFVDVIGKFAQDKDLRSYILFTFREKRAQTKQVD
jgi:transcription initiation factor TFIIIB Brf1 subunit/transcription initiation factor TFIIB